MAGPIQSAGQEGQAGRAWLPQPHRLPAAAAVLRHQVADSPHRKTAPPFPTFSGEEPPNGGAAAPAAAPERPPDGFYAVPNPLPPGRPGALIRALPIAGSPQLAGSRAWAILYHSRSLDGHDVAVTGTVLVPPGTGPSGGRLVLAWGHGSSGLADRCAPSRFGSGAFGPAGGRWLGQLLERGLVVAATDYQGLGTGWARLGWRGRRSGWPPATRSWTPPAPPSSCPASAPAGACCWPATRGRPRGAVGRRTGRLLRPRAAGGRRRGAGPRRRPARAGAAGRRSAGRPHLGADLLLDDSPSHLISYCQPVESFFHSLGASLLRDGRAES
jgi:hypothetical protein